MNESLNQILTDIEAYEQLLQEYASENEGEISDELLEWETEFFDKLIAKVDRTADFIRQCEKQAELAKETAKMETRKQKFLESLVTKTKNRLIYIAEQKGIKSFKGEKREIAIQNGGGLAPLEINKELIPLDKSFKIPVEGKTYPESILKTITVIDTTAMRELAESYKFDGEGLVIQGDPNFRIGERKKQVRIK